jgi:hypothetical protein
MLKPGSIFLIYRDPIDQHFFKNSLLNLSDGRAFIISLPMVLNLILIKIYIITNWY